MTTVTHQPNEYKCLFKCLQSAIVNSQELPWKVTVCGISALHSYGNLSR